MYFLHASMGEVDEDQFSHGTEKGVEADRNCWAYVSPEWHQGWFECRK